MMSPIPRSEKPIEVQTFYHFMTLSDEALISIKTGLYEAASRTGVHGLIILGPEGLNATASGDAASLRDFVRAAGSLMEPGFEFFNVKTSTIEAGEKLPFLDFVVKVRREIVTLNRPDLAPKDLKSPTHLSPEEWHRHISNPDVNLIDTRNAYESAIGTFKNAVTPDIEEFSEFPAWLDQATTDKAKPTYIFCTGGIRCEKAILAMQERGFEKVYQLDGGILNYIEKFPVSRSAEANLATSETDTQSLWDGECFVFDHRIAVDGNGRASKKFSACPHCGQPADHQVFCARCDSPAVLCDDCYSQKVLKNAVTCSKNCAHHWQARPGIKGKAQSSNHSKQ